MRDEYFQQVGLSLETYGFIDFRTNLYFPVGQTTQQSGTSIISGSQRFVGQNLAFDTLTTYLAAMRGLDFEAGVGLPGRFSQDHGIRAYLGGYYYDDDDGDHILGIWAACRPTSGRGSTRRCRLPTTTTSTRGPS